ncbi:hypothetical protein [Paenibacillus sedimenti]|uniref:Family 43 glycosylhydrolase n=1 Tax=Paenibacillus sedimenti TaxID=2770274 RepID=A0A926KTZ5_9BACL|nr:hypothetical protein [Paenibacillus sedimenti]MBD0384094.1 hypothetical protein [Paenibacillus sedimenti]
MKRKGRRESRSPLWIHPGWVINGSAGFSVYAANIDNRQIWHDVDGNFIHAHGGGFLQEGDYYYWFGENRQGGKKVSCYRSRDLLHWEFRNDVLRTDSAFKPVYHRTSSDMDPYHTIDKGYGSGAVIERPKVLHDALTGKYVMWM